MKRLESSQKTNFLYGKVILTIKSTETYRASHETVRATDGPKKDGQKLIDLKLLRLRWVTTMTKLGDGWLS